MKDFIFGFVIEGVSSSSVGVTTFGSVFTFVVAQAHAINGIIMSRALLYFMGTHILSGLGLVCAVAGFVLREGGVKGIRYWGL